MITNAHELLHQLLVLHEDWQKVANTDDGIEDDDWHDFRGNIEHALLTCVEKVRREIKDLSGEHRR